MNSEESAHVKTSGRQGRGHGDDERGVKPARDIDLPRRSVEILRDLGLGRPRRSRDVAVCSSNQRPSGRSGGGRGVVGHNVGAFLQRARSGRGCSARASDPTPNDIGHNLRVARVRTLTPKATSYTNVLSERRSGELGQRGPRPGRGRSLVMTRVFPIR